MSLKQTVKNVGLAAIIAGFSICSSCDSRNTNDSTKTYTLDPISAFHDDIVLIACANDKEYQGVMQSLHYRNNLRSSRFRLSFTPRDNYMKVSVPNIEANGSMKTTYMHVVKKSNLKEVLKDMDYKGINYDIIQLRGHTKDMRRLFNMTKDYSNLDVIYFFGGCNSYDIAKRKESANRATIGGKGRQETSRNTFYLLEMINLLGTDKADSWSKLEQGLKDADSSFNHYVSK